MSSDITSGAMDSFRKATKPWIHVLGIIGFLSGVAQSSAAADAANAGAGYATLRPTQLQTEHLSDPIGIEAQHPRFRWLLESTERAELQTAYQILVSGSEESLRADVGDKWDSGKVVSDDSVEVFYGGRPLTSGGRAYWKVRVWDQNGRPSIYSAPSFFEMGLLHPSDWKGNWIAATKGISSPLFRREFSVDAPVRRARVYVSGLGFYELSINGKRIGDRVLDPATTYYHNNQPFKLASRVLYSVYDVTSDLKDGANELGIMLGNGWYSRDANQPHRAWPTPFGERPCLILQMNVELTDGRVLNVISDSTWKTASGPVTSNDYFDGETYDARLEQAGWNAPGFNDASWENASPVEAPSDHLTAELLPPERVTGTLPAVNWIIPREPEIFWNARIYDFGQNFSGWVRIAVSGPRGTQLTLRYGARIHSEDNTLDTRSNEPPDLEPPSLVARQVDTYILKGEGTEIWEPRFTQHGFRYVEVSSPNDRPAVQKIEGRIVHSALESTGSFVSSNSLLNKIHHNIQWTLMSSLQGILQDSADRRERVSWLGDPSFVAEDYIDNYDMLGFWEKWLNDIEDNQKENGDIPFVSPLVSSNDGYAMWPCWKSTYPLLVWHLYQYYGDRQVLESHFDGLKRLVDFMSTAAHDHVISVGLGDHMEPQETGFSNFFPRHTPPALTSTAYYYDAVVIVSRIADVLGRTSDAKTYGKLAASIKDAFNRHFFNADTNQYATGSQTSNALALHLDMVPAQKVSAVMQNLVDDIVNKHDTHVSTGIIGSNAVVQVLPQHGAAPLMYKLATQTTYPSLGQQVMMGATTVCETYECGPWLSQNMKMFTSLDKFLYRDLAGIQLQSVGYRRVLIQPKPVGDLQSVSASQQTVRGVVAVDWFRGNTSFDLTVSIPAGMEAEIAIPTLGLMNVQITEGRAIVWKSGAYVLGTVGLASAKADSASVVFHAGSGSYHFTLSGAAF